MLRPRWFVLLAVRPGKSLSCASNRQRNGPKKTGNEVQVVSTPNDSNERLALYQQILGSGSDKVDVLQIDVVWSGLLATHLIDLKPYSKGVEKDHFPSIIANNTVVESW